MKKWTLEIKALIAGIVCCIFGLLATTYSLITALQNDYDKDYYVAVCHIGDDTISTGLYEWKIDGSKLSIIDENGNTFITDISNCYIVGTDKPSTIDYSTYEEATL